MALTFTRLLMVASLSFLAALGIIDQGYSFDVNQLFELGLHHEHLILGCIAAGLAVTVYGIIR